MPKPSEHRLWGIEQLSARSILIGALGSIVITASSMVVALKLSALPWPTVFVAVLSMGLLKLLGHSTQNEINIAQTGMSAGAMVAGGLAFTIPGLWIAGIYKPLDPATETLSSWLWPKVWPVFLIASAGMILGSLLCWAYRPRFIDTEALPYPIGTAAAETIQAGDEGGSKARLLFSTLGLTAVFTALRDKFALIPQALSTTVSQVPIALSLSPMAIGIGYIIGLEYTSYWMAGALFTSIVIVRLGVLWGAFADTAAAGAFNLTAAIGLMVGSGGGILLNFIASALQTRRKTQQKAGQFTRNSAVRTSTASTRKVSSSLIVLLSTAVAFVLTALTGLGAPAAALTLVGVVIATALAATITGQSGINPMEIFGIIILLAIRLFLPVDATGAFLIAAAVAVAAGYAGDLLNDYKAGAIIGTNPTAQLVSQIFGGVIGTFVAVIALFALMIQYGGVGGDTGLSAAQAHSVAAMVGGIGDPFVFLAAGLLGALLYWKRVPSMIIGIGMILPIGLSVAIFAGGLARVLILRFKATRTAVVEHGSIVAAGLLGGEGITGVILAILAMFQR